MNFADAISLVAQILSTIGAAIIFYGGLLAVYQILYGEILRRSAQYSAVRRCFTSKILVGLEFFIASDLIKSILAPTLSEVEVLAVIVAIRTVVSYSLEREIRELGPGN